MFHSIYLESSLCCKGNINVAVFSINWCIYLAGGGGDLRKFYIRKGSAPRSNSLPFIYHFLREKVRARYGLLSWTNNGCLPVLEDYKEMISAAPKKETFPFALQELFLYPVASAEKVSQKRRKKYIKKVFKKCKDFLNSLNRSSSIHLDRVSAEKQIHGSCYQCVTD